MSLVLCTQKSHYVLADHRDYEGNQKSRNIGLKLMHYEGGSEFHLITEILSTLRYMRGVGINEKVYAIKMARILFKDLGLLDAKLLVEQC